MPWAPRKYVQNLQGGSRTTTGQWLGFGIMTDGVFSNAVAGVASSIQQTTAWGVSAAYEHPGTRTGRRRSTAATARSTTTCREH